MSVKIIQGNALDLPLPDDSVDLVVTSPPYFGLRSYQDGGEHYAGQVGSEATPKEFVDALIAATREMMRVVKPTGSIWVNLGDKYAAARQSVPTKSLMGLPWRYALRCIDELGLLLRAEVIWSKPNGLPESVRDRVRRSHEQWFHFTLRPNYYANVDEVREPHVATLTGRDTEAWRTGPSGQNRGTSTGRRHDDGGRVADFATNPLGKLPGSVWTIATQPLRVPAELGVDHFAAFPMEWPRRIITGWSPPGVCTACGEGRRAVVERERRNTRPIIDVHALHGAHEGDDRRGFSRAETSATITGYACACPTPDAPTRPAVVLDPFGGTGTTALVADVLGRDGISVDLSSDYCRLATWRTQDPKERARVLKVKAPVKPKLAPVTPVDEPGEDVALF